MYNPFESTPENSDLGKVIAYPSDYNPTILFPIARKAKRDEIGVSEPLPFFGFDLWNHYEVSWLNTKGKPIAALAEIVYDCTSPYIIESKSLKLYFNSLNNVQFADLHTLESTIRKDLSERIGSGVMVSIKPLNEIGAHQFKQEEGICLDELDIVCSSYEVDCSLLSVETAMVDEVLYSHVLKSNCPVTQQPDWATVQITYKGRKINHEGLLQYIVSYRNHNEFHEQCIERIFMDIMQACKPHYLSINGRYTRRGGIDINPYRSTEPYTSPINNNRVCRQ